MLLRKTSLFVAVVLMLAGLTTLATVLQRNAAVPSASQASSRATEELPTSISDGAFWRMVSEFSEDSSQFPPQLMSNEMGYQVVVPELKQITKPGGAYLGVGPEQNFTYIAALEPGVAFIIDIRRQNMLEHLIYKAVFEVSSDRAEFVSRLFSRRKPAGLSGDYSAKMLFNAYNTLPLDAAMFDSNLKSILSNLIQEHHFDLASEDRTEIRTIYKSLCDLGPVTWEPALNIKAIYGNLMTDTDAIGMERSYLASEANFQSVRSLQRRNLIVPIVGDFAGNKSLRAVSQYLREQHATVSAFYASNVEDYLFTPNNDAWRRFYSNVRTLPMDAASTFIRSEGSRQFATRTGAEFQRKLIAQPGGTDFTSLLSSMSELIQAFDDGQIQNQTQVLQMSRKNQERTP